MKIIKGILVALVVIALIITVVGFLSPQQMRVERSLMINAPSEIIHEQINNLKNWTKWSPWYKMDTAMKMEYNGTDAGAGASYKWNSTEVGTGDMTITSSTPDSISTALNMEYGPAIIKFLLAKSEDGTKITWIMEKDNGMNPWSRFFGLFMDGMVGKDFEKGLAGIKEVAEAIPTGPKLYRGYEIAEKDSPEMIYIGIKDSIGWDKIGEFYSKNLPVIFEAVGKQKLELISAPSGIFFSWDTVHQSAIMAAAIAVKGDANTKVKGYETYIIPAGKMLHIAYFGAYEKTAEAHYGMDEYILEKGLTQNIPIIEEYVTDPMVEKDTAKWLTNIYYPLK